MKKLRPVKVSERQFHKEDVTWTEHEIGTGVFHHWVRDTGNVVIEMDDGQVKNIQADLIQFLDKEKP